MPPILIAVAAAAVGAAATAGAAAVIGATILGSALLATAAASLIGAVVAGAVAYGATALIGGGSKAAKKAAATPGASGAQDRKIMVRTPVAPRVNIYGRARVGGALVYVASSGSAQEYLHLVLVLAGHRIEAINNVFLNDIQIAPADLDGGGTVNTGVFNGKVRIKKYLGTQTTADSDLVAESPDGWSTDHKLLGCAYLYVRLEYTQDLFQSGIPNISAEVLGRDDIFDPRDASTGYTDNPALCILHYLMSDTGIAATGDELAESTFISAANLCDEAVDLNADGSLTQQRYDLDGVFSSDAAPIDVLEDMLTSCGGTMTYVQGEHRLYAGAFISATGTLTEADMAGPITLETKPSRRDLFNSVRGTFIDPARNWQQAEFPAWQDAGLITDDGETIWQDIDLPFTIDNVRAQRLAKMLLDRSRESITIRCPVKYAGLRYVVWQTINVTLADFGFTAKPFRIVSWTFDPVAGIVNLTLREESAASYAWLYDDPAAYPDAPDSSLIDPLTIPVPSGVTLTPTTVLNADGAAVPAVEVTWTASAHAFVTAYEVQWRVTSGPGPWNSIEVRGVTRAIIAPVIIGQGLDVRVRAVAGLVRSAWSSTANGSGAPDTTAPATPTGLTIIGGTRLVTLNWTNPTDADLATVEIHERADSSGAPYAKVGEASTDFFSRAGFNPNERRYFKIRSRDRSGNLSGFTAEVLGQANLLVASDIQDGILNTAKFAAGLTPVEIVGALPGSGNFAGRIVFLTTDSKLYRFDGSAWTVQVNGSDIGDGTIIYGKLSAGAVRAAEVFAGELRAIHMAAETVIASSVQLGTAVVTTAKIDNAAITNAKIGTAEIDELKVAGQAITSHAAATWTDTIANIKDGTTRSHGSMDFNIPTSRDGFVVATYRGETDFTVPSGDEYGGISGTVTLPVGLFPSVELQQWNSGYTTLLASFSVGTGSYGTLSREISLSGPGFFRLYWAWNHPATGIASNGATITDSRLMTRSICLFLRTR